MARPALSATRGLDIIDLLAGHPGRGFTLSEVVRATGINNASCHAILGALVERGYVVRDPFKRTFGLGPVLIAVGAAAVQAQPLLERAGRAARELAAELDVPVLLSAAVGDEIVGIVAAGDPLGRPPELKPGERRPLVPPLGSPFVAWEDDAAISDWLARGSHAKDAAFAATQRHNLDLIRARGFQVLLRTPGDRRLAPEIADMARARGGPSYKDRMRSLADRVDAIALPETIEAGASYDVILIAAPVFDRAGACVYNLCLGDFARLLTGAEVIALAERLLAACIEVMQADRG